MTDRYFTLNPNSEKNNNGYFLGDLKYIFCIDFKFIIFAFILAIATHVLLWLAYPLHWGPDGPNYIYYYLDILRKEPLFPMILTYRTPIAPLFYGLLLDIGGSITASVVLEILVIILIPSVYLLSFQWGKNAARASTIAFILFLPFQIQFHQISSDALFSFFLILFFLTFKYAIIHKNIVSWVILGIISAFTILTRPSGIIIVLALLSIFFLKLGFKKIIKLTAVYLLCILTLLLSFVVFKGLRYNDYSLSRGSDYTAFMRVYTLHEPLWNPKNGPDSEKLAKIVEKNLLSTDLYKKYNITMDKVLNNWHNRRILGDIIVTVDRTEGWDTGYKLLKNVAAESVKAYPYSYLKNYIKDIISLLTIEQTIPEIPGLKDTKIYLNNINNYSIQDLPEPTEGELIPFSNTWWMLSRPDGGLPIQSEIDDFNSRYENLVFSIDNPVVLPGFLKIIEFIWKNIKIPIFYFWVFSLFGLIFSNKNSRIFIISVLIISLIIMVGTIYGAHVYTRYRLPFDPLIMISGIGGFSVLLEKIMRNSHNNRENSKIIL